jgi:hypothetical protein
VSKKIWFGMMVLALLFGMMVIGCEEEQPKKTYYYEAYSITMAQYNNFSSSFSGGLNYTFSQIRGFRQTLRSYNGTFIESNSGVSESELKTFANQHGIGGSEYTQAKDSLDSVGNLIAFFSSATSPSSYVVWMYVEKE